MVLYTSIRVYHLYNAFHRANFHQVFQMEAYMSKSIKKVLLRPYDFIIVIYHTTKVSSNMFYIFKVGSNGVLIHRKFVQKISRIVHKMGTHGKVGFIGMVIQYIQTE
jgi:hypothetical protein